MASKTHRSAVVVIPPLSVWEPIQAVRQRYNRKIGRWMPHITLFYPFWPQAAFARAERIIRRAVGTRPKFTVGLQTVRTFGHGRSRYTLWLDPIPKKPLSRLQVSLCELFPDCDDVTRFPKGFTPHLSLGQARGRKQLEARLADIRGSWEPLEFEVSEVSLIARAADGPFEVDRTIALGG